MIVAASSQSFKPDNKTVVGVGFFDGFHIGHEKILNDVLEEAARKSAASVIYTYHSHPDNVLRHKNTPLLMSIESRIEYLESKGLDVLCMDDFNEEYAGMPAEKFIDNILLGRLNAVTVVAGFNYTFGEAGRGDTDFLAAYGKAAGFDVHIVPPVIIDGKIVSSTLIRGYVSSGNMEAAAIMLGRPYSIEGIVSTGHKIGRRIGFPTANITPDPTLSIPENGVYMTATLLDGKVYKSITNVGMNPTVSKSGEIRFETHIIDFNMEIYMKRIKVYFIRKIRDEMVFKSRLQLAEQIQRDVLNVDSEWRKAGGVDKWFLSI